MTATYIARLTWNQDQWRRPSGVLGKSEKGTYVVQQGFGHEEWLNRAEWLCDGWRYAFVQGVSKSRSGLEGQKIDIVFYALTPLEHSRCVYVGKVTNAEVLTVEQAAAALKQFKSKGWTAVMRHEVESAGGRVKTLDHSLRAPTEIFNIRFRPNALKVFAQPVPVPAHARVRKLPRYQLFAATDKDYRTFQEKTRQVALTHTTALIIAPQLEFPEGAKVQRVHEDRERKPALVRHKKALVLQRTGKLACEACGFVFARTYGEVGEDFIECHHTVPVSELKPGHKTKPEDVVLLCSNCHRMVHRKRPWLTLPNLSKLLVAD